MTLRVLMAVVAICVLPVIAWAQNGPLPIEITEGVVEPMPFAAPNFVPESGAANEFAERLARVVVSDLAGTGLFREVPRDAYISQITSFDAPVQYVDWKAINAQALVTGAVNVSGSNLSVKFRVYDVFSGTEIGSGLQFAGTTQGWRRMAHKVADQVYARITGEQPYFDSRVVYVSEQGPKDKRRKRLAIMD